MHKRRWPMPTSLILAIALLPTTQFGWAAETIQVQIAANEGASVQTVVRYFDDDQLSSESQQLIDVADRAAELPLEPGHDGLQVFVLAPASIEVTAQLFVDEQVVEAPVRKRGLATQLTYGNVPNGAELANSGATPLPRVRLNEIELRLVRRFLDALATQSSEGFPSTTPISNLDWQCLDAFAQVVQRELGNISENNPPPAAGWISVPDDGERRLITGNVQFERGRCRFRLTVFQAEVIDVQYDSAAIAPDWFAGPADDDLYDRQLRQLAEALFAGEPLRARNLFSARYLESVTVEALSTLSVAIRKDFGDQIVEIQELRSDLAAFDYDTNARVSQHQYRLQMANDRIVVATGEVAFHCGQGTVGRGHVAAIYFRESWPSASVEQVQTAREIVRQLAAEPQDNQWLPPLLHSEVAKWISAEALNQTLGELRAELGPPLVEQKWDLWSAESVGAPPNRLTRVVGKMQFESSDADVWLDFASDQSPRNRPADNQNARERLVTFTVFGPSLAISTANAIANAAKESDPRGDDNQGVKQAVALGQEFWLALLSNRLSDAYVCLSPAFRKQVSLAEFQLRFAGGIPRGDERVVEVSRGTARVATRLDRPLPALLAVHYVARQANGARLTLRCEFGWSSGQAAEQPQIELLNFNSDFADYFPVAQPADASLAILNALRTGNAQTLIDRSSEQDRVALQRDVLQAFLETLGGITGTFDMPQSYSFAHRYGSGVRTEVLRTQVVSKGNELAQSGDVIPVTIVTEFGELKSFEFQSPALNAFPDPQQDAPSEALVQRFVKQWLGDPTSDLTSMLVPQLRAATVEDKLSGLAEKLVAEFGQLESLVLNEPRRGDPAADEPSNSLVYVCTVRCADKSVLNLEVIVQYDALACFVYSVSVVR